MHIAVMGTGALGGYFGGRLQAAGTRVSFIARGAQLDALNSNGLAIKSELGDLHLPSVTATDDPEAIGPVDLVLFMVKLYDTKTAGDACRPLIGPETAVVTFQNGIDGPPMLKEILGAEHVMGGSAYCPAVIEAPGEFKHSGTMAKLVFGELDRKLTPRAQALGDALEAAGVLYTISDDINRDLWKKFVPQSAFSGVSALLRKDLGEIRAAPDTRALLKAAFDESVAVANAKKIPLRPEDIEEGRAQVFETWTPQSRASLLHDLEIGKPMELPWMSGTIVRLGKELGVPTPTHSFITTALKLHAKGRR